MPPVALALIVAAAVAHAGWNFAAKQARYGGPALPWWGMVGAVVVYAPLAWIYRQAVTPTVVLVTAVGAILQVAYFLLLQRGYASGDMSVVYPLARGTGPVLSVTVAVLFLGERPGQLALLGAAALVTGAAGVTAGSRAQPAGPGRAAGGSPLGGNLLGRGIGYGLATGALIAAYTVWDAHAVAGLAIGPVFFYWCNA